ncbi:hypothetical protein FACS1894187_14750 [Synergistales bacterium]|nr:hypothetical protein FACS1894187_14750 [Synergistales bacterium]
MKTFLGIDFGTTQTLVTMIKEGSNYEPEIVEISGKKAVDTALRLDADDNVVFFGADALDRIHEAPDDTFYNFKVAIGSGKVFRSSSKDYRAETLALIFLKTLREKIEKKYFNVANLEELEDLYCTIGCPAAWNEIQRRKIIDLAKKAGFPNVSCCDEPFGVIYYYHFRGDLSLKKPQNILVYDFGGGTTDVAIEEISPLADGSPCKTPRVLAASGMSNLGGREFDEKLREYFIQEMHTDATTLGGKDLKTLERYSKAIKETLSIAVDDGTDSVEKTIPMLSSKRSSHKLSLSKQNFEQVCGSLIEQLEEPVYDALSIAMLEANQIDDVIVAGGSSRLYYVKSRIKALFPKTNIVVSANPVEVIAKGLALYSRAFVCEAKAEPVQQENSRQEKVESADKKIEPQREPVKPKQEKPASGRKWLPLLAVAAVIIIAILGIGYFYLSQSNRALDKIKVKELISTFLVGKTILLDQNGSEQSINMAEGEISNLTIQEPQNPSLSGSNTQTLQCQFILNKNIAKLLIEAKITYSFDTTNDWSIQDMYVLSSKVQSVELAGDWIGRYIAGQGATGLILQISEISKDGVIKAVFNFEAIPENPSIPSGSYGMVGKINFEDLTVTLEGKEWLRQPTGYLMLNLIGYLDIEKSAFLNIIRYEYPFVLYKTQQVSEDNTTRTNIGDAKKWYSKVAEQGHPTVQYNLGMMYATGSGVSRDYNQAVEWFRKAAEQGSANAQYSLGYMYEAGNGVVRNSQEAYFWFYLARLNGDKYAQTELNKLEITLSRSAINNIQYRADQTYEQQTTKDAETLYKLGQKYENGDGVTKDYHQAREYYRKAADSGHAEAQRSLGLMYMNSKGVTRDNEEAYFYLYLAHLNGAPYAQKHIANFAYLLPQAKIEIVQQRATQAYEQQKRNK